MVRISAAEVTVPSAGASPLAGGLGASGLSWEKAGPAAQQQAVAQAMISIVFRMVFGS